MLLVGIFAENSPMAFILFCGKAYSPPPDYDCSKPAGFPLP
jgi:hypothetical protein